MSPRIVLVALLLAGCSLTPPPAPAPARYDLGPVPPAAAATAGLPLRIAEIAAPPWLEHDGIGYRLAYRDAFRREVYRDSRWAAPPPALLALRLRQQMAVAPTAQKPTAAPRSLHLQLDEFDQVFASPTQSQAVLRVRARWGGSGAAERVFVVTRDAPSADAAGAVRGLAAASDELAAQLLRWAQETAP